jgi:hypothetical protein
MRLTRLFLIGILAAGASAPAFSDDGYDRSITMNEKFREDQKRLWGDKEKRQPVVAQETPAPKSTP